MSGARLAQEARRNLIPSQRPLLGCPRAVNAAMILRGAELLVASRVRPVAARRQLGDSTRPDRGIGPRQPRRFADLLPGLCADQLRVTMDALRTAHCDAPQIVYGNNATTSVPWPP